MATKRRTRRELGRSSGEAERLVRLGGGFFLDRETGFVVVL